MKKAGWIVGTLLIIVLLMTIEISIIGNASGAEEKKPVVFTKVPVEKGTLVTADMLETREIGREAQHPEALAQIQSVVGKRACVPLLPGEMVLKSRLSEPGHGIIKADDINNRLFGLELKGDQANVWRLTGNSRIDIIFIPNHGNLQSQPSNIEGLKEVVSVADGVRILENIRVAGLTDGDGKPVDLEKQGNEPKYVLFEVTQEQAAFLAYAKSIGKLELASIPTE